MNLLNRIISAYIIIVLFLPGCSPNSDKPEEQSQESQATAHADSIYVTQVLDGDTFILSNGESVRIVMIDTPEREQPLYQEATDYLAGLVLNRAVTLKRAGTGRDRYDRVLAEVMLDTINVGRRMVYNGYAVMYVYPDNRNLVDTYLPAQKSAINRRAGLWGLPAPVPEEFYLNTRGSYRFHRSLCGHLKDANPANFIRYESRLEALSEGLSPCRSCKP